MNEHVRKYANVRTARLFRNGRSQAVRIPKQFELEGKEVTITRESGNRLVIEPKNMKMDIAAYFKWLKAQRPFDEAWENPTDRDLPPLDDVEI